MTSHGVDVPSTSRRSPARSFTLVLGGGGARGFAHAGVLRALEHYGLRPHAIVGVSMGAVVGVTYAMRQDWYEAVLNLRLGSFPGRVDTPDARSTGIVGAIGRGLSGARTLLSMAVSWGPGTPQRRAGLAELRKLVGTHTLAESRIPVLVTATDLRSGDRVVLRSEQADEAVYASGALAGVLPPIELGPHLLADGAYTDLAPVDLAREFGSEVVIAVNAGQSEEAAEIRNGFQAVLRAMEICHRHHAHLRFAQADLVLHPEFPRRIDTLEFSALRECVAAGVHTVRHQRHRIRELLER